MISFMLSVLFNIILVVGILIIYCLVAKRYVLFEARELLKARWQAKRYASKHSPAICFGPCAGAYGDVIRLSEYGITHTVYPVQHKNALDKNLKKALSDCAEGQSVNLVISF